MIPLRGPLAFDLPGRGKKGGKAKGKSSKASQKAESRRQRALDRQFTKAQKEAEKRAAALVQELTSSQPSVDLDQDRVPLPEEGLSPDSEGSEIGEQGLDRAQLLSPQRRSRSPRPATSLMPSLLTLVLCNLRPLHHSYGGHHY